jgi:hypothetical protein
MNGWRRSGTVIVVIAIVVFLLISASVWLISPN